LRLPRPTPVVFGPADAQLFGLHHAPDPEVARGTGVVLCNPLGDEAMCVHRTYRYLAERLAAAGFPTLRFDYHGTGDSSGEDDDPDRVRAWLESIDASVEELRAAAGLHAVALVGVRFGATLAAMAAARRRDVESVVLWAPCTSGRAYLRELRAFQMLKEHKGQGTRFDETTVDGLMAIDLLARRERIAARALVVPRDDVPDGGERLADRFVRRRDAPPLGARVRLDDA
jgi:pimeloyl-ACP methyl ester carboxylesterase